jgi:hypothetical protein
MASRKRSSQSDNKATEGEQITLREKLRRLYFGRSHEAHRFRYALLGFDILVILFIVATSFTERTA